MSTRKVGRDAISGRFIPLRTARRFPAPTTIETIETPSRCARAQRRRARHVTEKTRFEDPEKNV